MPKKKNFELQSDGHVLIRQNTPNVHAKKKLDISSTESKKRIAVLDLSRTVAAELFCCRSRPWEALFGISNYIYQKGCALPYDQYDEISENVWVHVTAYLSPTAKIKSPAIICGGSKISHGAYVEGSIIGSSCTVGEQSCVKGSILFDRVRLSPFCDINSSVLGYNCSADTLATLCDNRMDGTCVLFDMPDGVYLTGKKHLGSVVCDGVRIGAQSLINPGSLIDGGAKIYPRSSVSGYVYPLSEFRG